LEKVLQKVQEFQRKRRNAVYYRKNQSSIGSGPTNCLDFQKRPENERMDLTSLETNISELRKAHLTVLEKLIVDKEFRFENEYRQKRPYMLL